MKQVSNTYQTLRNQTGSYYNVKVARKVTNGPDVEYGLDKLKSIRVGNALFEDNGPQVGGVCSSTCELSLLENTTNWPRMAEFEVLVQLTSADGLTVSEWLSMGTYYTDERQEQGSTLRIVAFDAMLLAERMWADTSTWADPSKSLPATWPITAKRAAEIVRDATGIQFTNMAALDDEVKYIGLDTTSTCRDLLRSIAVGCGGNWYVTTSGTLKLIQLTDHGDFIPAVAGIAIAGVSIVGTEPPDISDAPDYEVFQVGLSCRSFKKSMPFTPISRVEIENTAGTIASAGSTSGYILKAKCEYANSGIASVALSNVDDYVYRPFQADGARLDPAAEIGDYVVVDNDMFPIIAISWNIAPQIVADISAPWEEEVDHEYMTLDENTKSYRKAMADVERNYVQKAEFSSEIIQNADSVVIAVSGTYVTQDEFERVIDHIDGQIETWSGSVVPTLNNYPASTWTTTELKNNHIGDLYLVLSDSGITEAGRYYRFERSNGVYSWNVVSDNALTEALDLANQALVAAQLAQDGIASLETQITVFTAQPSPPYKVGDVWFHSQGIRQCITARESGNYNPSDWAQTYTYTDDTTANQVANSLSDYVTAATYNAQIATMANEISAKVSVEDGDTSSFGWSLTTDEHAWYANGSKVMSVSAGGLSVTGSGTFTGEIRASSGYIGSANNGFTITSNAIYNGMESMSDDEHNGVYIGTNGIALGRGAFKVTSSGAVTASNLALTGGSIRILDGEGNVAFAVSSTGAVTASNINVTGGTININGGAFRVDSEGNLYAESGTFGGDVYAANIQSGGDYGYIGTSQLASGINSSLGYANAYNLATQVNPSSYPAQFTATGVYADWLFAKQSPGTSGAPYYSVKDHTHDFTVGNDGKIHIGTADLTGADHFFNIADTQVYRDGVSAVTVSSVLEYSYSATADKQVVFDNDHVHYDSSEEMLSGRANVLLSNNTSVTLYVEMDASSAGGGGICPVMEVTASSYVAGSSYSQLHLTFVDNTTQDISLPTVYNAYTQESETLYNYAQYIGGRSPTITNSSVTPVIYSASNPYQLEVEAEFSTNGSAKSFQATINVYDVYEAGREAGGGGICPIMEIASVAEHSYSSSADFNLVFDNAYLRYDSVSDLLKGRILVTMEDGNTQSIFVQMDAQRKSLTPPAYAVTNGNVQEDQTNPYDPTSPYVFNVVATFDVDGNHKSYTSWVNVYNVYQAGVAEGESHGGTYVGGWYTLLGDPELCLVNYAQVQTQLYFYEDGRYQPWTGVDLYYGTQSVRYDSGNTVYLYELQT